MRYVKKRTNKKKQVYFDPALFCVYSEEECWWADLNKNVKPFQEKIIIINLPTRSLLHKLSDVKQNVQKTNSCK